MRFEDLPDVHPARHAKRIEHDVGMRTVFEERHVLDRHDLRHHALVAVTAGHLVAGLDLALHRDEDLDHLHHARPEFVTTLQLLDLVEEALLEALLALVVGFPDSLYLCHHLVVGDGELPPLRTRILFEHRPRQMRVLLETLRAGDANLAFQKLSEAAVNVAIKDRLLVVAVLGKAFDLLTLDRECTLVLVNAMTVENAHFDDRALHSRRDAQGRVAHIARLLAEDRTQQFLFRRHRAFALRRDLAAQNVAGAHFRTDVDDARLVQILERLFRNVRDVAGDFLRAQLRIAGHHLELLDVDRREHVVLHDAFGEKDRVLEIVAVPGHERDQHVAAEREFAEVGRGTVRNDVALFHVVAHLHQRPLVDAGVLVGALELHQAVDIDARLGRIEIFRGAHNDTRGVHLIDDAGAARTDRGTRVARDRAFHAGSDERRLGAHQRHGLTLHVRAHQSAVCVIVLEERNERGRHRNKLFRRDVHVVDLIGRYEHDVARMPAGDEVFGEAPTVVDRLVRLRNGVAAFLHRREVVYLIRDAAVLHLAVWRFDETVFVHPRIGSERVDQADVRTFRGLDWADPAVMGRMHVAHLKPRTLARQTARAERRETPLVRDLGERVGLVHELRELRGAEELAHRSSRGLRVDQVLRHDGVDIDRRHALLDRALHAQEADPVLVLHQLADRAHPSIAEVVDVVDLTPTVAQVNQRFDDREDVFLAQHAHGVGCVELEPHVHLDAADRGEVVALGIEEQRVEHRLGRIDRGRLARAHHAIDVEQRVFTRHVLVDRIGVADVGADIDVVDVEQRQFLVARLVEDLEVLFGDLLTGLDVDFAGLRINEVLADVVADQFLIGHAQRLQPLLGELTRLAHGELLAGLDHDLAAVGVDEVVDSLVAAHAVGIEGHPPAFFCALVDDLLVEGVEHLFAVHAEREQQRRHRNLAAPVDTRMHDVLRVKLDIEPRAAIRNDARGEQELSRRVRLALVVVEEHARRAVHLRDDDALGAVHDERAVVGHERDVAHVHVLLLNVLHGARAGLLIHIEHDEAQLHLQRRSERHAALTAFVNVVFRRLEFVADEVELRGVRKIPDREDRLEHALQALVGPAAYRFLHQQELVVGRLLNLDEVRHLRDFLDFPEKLTNALATNKSLRSSHVLSSPSNRSRARTTLRRAAINRDRLDRRQAPISPRSGPLSGPPKGQFRRWRLYVVKPGYKYPILPYNPPAGGFVVVRAGRVCPGHSIFRWTPGFASLTRGVRSSCCCYLSSTFAPAFSSWALTFSASSFGMPSFTGFGAPSTRSLASFSPRPVRARTSLMTSIFLSPAAARTTVNSVFSSAGAAAAAAGPATATAAAAETPHFSSSILARSAASSTVRLDSWSTILLRSAISLCSFYPVRTNVLDGKPHAASPFEA